MEKKHIVIWGAGRIGRGFVADLFEEAGFDLVFVDTDEILVDGLRKAGRYSILRIKNENDSCESVIEGFRVFSSSDQDGIDRILQDCELMAVCVFPTSFDGVASRLAMEIERRARMESTTNLDILICANIPHPSAKLLKGFEGILSEPAHQYLDSHIGLIDTAVMRMAIDATPEQRSRDPFLVVTNCYDEMPVDASAFKGVRPVVPGLQFVENMRAEETRKMFTYNMLHALYAYVGQSRGHTFVFDCTQDVAVQAIAEGALDEVCQALEKEFGFTQQEMEKWARDLKENMANPALKDRLTRVGSDAERKLKRTDRLVGPLLLCRKHGILPYYLAKAIAGAFTFENSGDLSLVRIKEHVKEHGIREAICEYCQLEMEADLVQLIAVHYQKFVEGIALSEDSARIRLLARAYGLGFHYEKTYKGCAQCTLAALYELTDHKNEILFQAASGLSGGIAICGDGSCGGYTGGVLYMSFLIGRRLDRIPIDGDKIDQYRSYEMAQKLHDRYLETYGGVTCADIHVRIFGCSFCLRTKPVRDEFEAAGAHIDKCTTVIATACTWVAEILLDEKLIDASGRLLT